MAKIKIPLILLMLSGLQVSLAQDLIITGVVFDSTNEKGIPSCHVLLKGQSKGAITDSSGAYELRIKTSNQRKIYLVFSHLGYQAKDIRRRMSKDSASAEDRHMKLDINLDPKSISLPVVSISADPLPEIVYASTRHGIADYEFIDDQLIILTYEKNQRKASTLYWLDHDLQVTDSLPIPTSLRVIGLAKDYADRVYLETQGFIYRIRLGKEESQLIKMDRDDYADNIAPVLDSTGNMIYFTTLIDCFPAFDYYGYDRTDSTYHHIVSIADDFMMKLCRAEYKYLSTRDKLRMFRMELETGIEKEVLTCIKSYDDGLYYQPLYAPLFMRNDSLFIFDHPSKQLKIYSKEGVPLDSVQISYHRPEVVLGNHFTEELIIDNVEGSIYALFQYPGGRHALLQIDTATGEIQEEINLRYRYASCIKVRAGEVYYTYRPFESSQKKYLYKESL